MRIAELTASAARFAEEISANSGAQKRNLHAEYFFARRLLAISRFNVPCGRKPFMGSRRKMNAFPPVPKCRVGAKRQRHGSAIGPRVLQRTGRSFDASAAPARLSADIIILRPERSHFADFETRLARAREMA
jgi:hypothetical protein